MLGAPTLGQQEVAYGLVYAIEIGLLMAALAAIGPLVRYIRVPEQGRSFGLASLPS